MNSMGAINQKHATTQNMLNLNFERTALRTTTWFTDIMKQKSKDSIVSRNKSLSSMLSSTPFKEVLNS